MFSTLYYFSSIDLIQNESNAMQNLNYKFSICDIFTH